MQIYKNISVKLIFIKYFKFLYFDKKKCEEWCASKIGLLILGI